MTKFLKIVALTGLIFIALSTLLTSLIYSTAGNRPVTEVESPFLIEKERLVRADESINTLFVGSSIMYRQIDPDVFDSSASADGEFRSYNLGNPGLYPMRSVSYLEYLIENPPPSIKHIVFELFRLDTVTFNYKSPEIMRLAGFANFVDILQTIGAANFPLSYKFYLAGQYARAFAFKALGFGVIDYLQMERSLRPVDIERLGFVNRGYLAKDTEIAQTRDAENRAHIEEVGALLEQQPQLLGPRIQANKAKYARDWKLASSPYVEKLRDLIAQAERKGITLVYVLPPLLTEPGIYFAYPTYLQMPEGSRLDLSDPERFPDVYAIDNVFDLEHVNSAGAVPLSRYLAEEFSGLMQAGQQ
jgi:hypothetical protein